MGKCLENTRDVQNLISNRIWNMEFRHNFIVADENEWENKVHIVENPKYQSKKYLIFYVIKKHYKFLFWKKRLI